MNFKVIFYIPKKEKNTTRLKYSNFLNVTRSMLVKGANYFFNPVVKKLKPCCNPEDPGSSFPP